MVSLLIYYPLIIAFYSFAVSAQTFSFRQRATGPGSVCAGSDVTLQCMIIIINPDNTATVQPIVWSRDGMSVEVTNTSGSFLIPNHRQVFNSTTGGFTDLVITNVTLEDNNTPYTCTATGTPMTSSVVLNVTGPPNTVTDGEILSDAKTACNFVVQWNDVSSNDSVCGPVWYRVEVSTKEEMSIVTNNTNYTVTGLNDNTVYYVSVTACNNAGSSNSSTRMMIMTNSSGLPSNTPNITSVSPLSNSLFTVNWTISDPNYSYTVIWTNLNTIVVDNFTVPENTNNYTVTGLNDTDSYIVSVAAVNMCGNITSDPITVTASTLFTSPTPSPSNTPGSRNLEDDNSNGNTIVIIVVLIVVITVVAAVVVTVIGSILCWRHFHKEGFIKPNESDENNYTQPNGNSPQSQQKPNEDYAYAMNGPRGVVLPSSSSLKV